MSGEIMVYFNSGNKARLRKDSTVILANCPDSKAVFENVDDLTFVNWNNVCFIREYHEPKVEDLLHDAD